MTPTTILLDTETTDVENCEVIEAAYIAFNDIAVGPIGSDSQRFRSTKCSTFGALATHHILPEDLDPCPHSENAPGWLPRAEYWVGHNIDFDWRALGAPPRPKRICTLALSRFLWPEVDSHSLSAMTYFTQGVNRATRAKLLGAHSAAIDTQLLAELLEHILAKVKPANWESLYAASEDARVPRIWTFGKFKGKPIGAADRGYANWYRRQPDTDPYVIEALTREGLI